MTALNKQALLVPERKIHDWSLSVMRDCDFCSQWSLTVKHENGACICPSCCDAEYTEELKSALESAIDRAESAEKQLASWRRLAKKNIEEHEKAVAALDAARHRVCELESKLTQNESWSLAAQKYIAELEARTVTMPTKEHDNGTDSQIDINAGFANRMWQKCADAIRAAGIGVKGE